MYTFFQPKILVAQEETDIQEIINEEYERRKQEERDYCKAMEEEMYKQMEEDYYNHLKNRRLNYE